MAGDFADAWERGDLRAMHVLLSDEAERALSRSSASGAAYRRAAATATMTELDAGDPEAAEGSEVTVPVVVETRVFGSLRGDLRVPVIGRARGLAPRLVFPELRARRALSRA